MRKDEEGFLVIINIHIVVVVIVFALITISSVTNYHSSWDTAWWQSQEIKILRNNNYFLLLLLEASRSAVAQSVTVKPIGCGFDLHSRSWNIYLNLYFHFFALGRGKARRWVLPLNMQCLQISAESGERSVLRLSSLCLPCCMRGTAWS